MTQPNIEPTPEFNARCMHILDRWESGELPFKDAVDQMNALGRTAVERGHLVDHGRVELLLGTLQGYRANLDASIAHFEHARTLFEQAGNRPRAIGALLSLGETYRWKGDFKRARQLFRATYDGACELGLLDVRVISAYNEALMLLSLGHVESAKAQFDKALLLANDLPPDQFDKRIELTTEIQAALVEVYLSLNDPFAAWEQGVMAYHLAWELKQPLQTATVHRALGQVISTLSALPDDAPQHLSADPDEHFRLATEAFQEIKADGEVARTMYAHGVSLAQRGRTMAASRKLQQSMIIFTRLGMADYAAKAAQAQTEVLSYANMPNPQ